MMMLRVLLAAAVCIISASVQQSTNPRIIEHPEDQFVAKNEPATLNCTAEGSPPPIITWYRNGQPVSTSSENPSSHRVLLPSGQLFFLRIIHNNNNKPDAGVYYCKAENPETGAAVISRNATLEIAGGLRNGTDMVNYDIDLVTEVLRGQVVNLMTPEVLNSTTIKLHWQLLVPYDFIEGFHIKYRVMPDITEDNTEDLPEYTIETVERGTITTYILRNLRSFTWYEIKVQPFYQTVEGHASQVKRVRTLQALPTATAEPPVPTGDKDNLYAHCNLAHAHADVPQLQGTVDFRQLAGSECLEIRVNVTGLNSSDNVTQHGLHVHTFGQDTDGCSSMGGHWNPDDVNHGSNRDPFDSRHPGDFGNMQEDGNGQIVQYFLDPLASLSGEYKIAGHGLVLHEHVDDLGRGDNEGSRASGNAGKRYGCCIITMWDDSQWD